jgi:hypothetical protein
MLGLTNILLFVCLIFLLLIVFLLGYKFHQIILDTVYASHRRPSRRRRRRRRPSSRTRRKINQKDYSGYSELSYESGIEKTVAEKRRKLRDIPNIRFHYVRKDLVESYYNDYFKEPIIKELISEEIGERLTEVKGSVPQILESNLGDKELSKWISTIKLPETSLSAMFLRYQRKLIEENQVLLGIEEADIESSEVEEFDHAIEHLCRRFALKLDENLLNEHRNVLKEKAAKKILKRMEKASGLLLIEGKFLIDQQEEYYKCVYEHPVNSYLSRQTNSVVISFRLKCSDIEPDFSANYETSIRRSIPLKVFGNVWQPLSIKDGNWEFQIVPIAVY